MGLKPGYKQTDVGVIPEDWQVRAFSDLGESLIGLTYKPNDVRSDGTLVLRSSNIQEGSLRFDDNVFVKTLVPERLMARPGDILICVRNGSRDLIGKCAHLDDRTLGMTFGAFMTVFRSDAHDFVYQQMRSQIVKRQITEHLGATINQITNKSLNSFEIPLPPTKAEQQTIADALSDADALIESLEQLLVKKCQIKQGAMQELLTGKKRLPDFTGEWQPNTLSTVIDALYAGVSVNSIDEVADIGSGDLAILKTSCVDRGVFIPNENKRITKKEAGRARLNPRADTILISRMNTIDLVGECGYVQRDYPHLFVPDRLWMTGFKQDAEVSARWLSYLLSSKPYRDFLKTIATGTSGSMKNIAKGSLLALEVSFPSLQEQCAISTVLADIDAAIEQLELKLTKARRLKQGMMQELLAGRIRLSRTSAKVLSFPVEETASVAKVSHNTQINEAVVIAVLSAKFGSDKFPLGRFRRTKFSYLLHRHVELEAAGFMKKAAGPYNPRTRYGGAEKIALQNRYVRVLSTGKSEGFVADENIAQAEGYFEKWYGAEVLTWLEQFRYQKNDALELLTTVDMACQDLSQAGKAATLSAVKQIIHDSPEWRAKLNRAVFSDDNIATTIQSCGQLFPIEEE